MHRLKAVRTTIRQQPNGAIRSKGCAVDAAGHAVRRQKDGEASPNANAWPCIFRYSVHHPDKDCLSSKDAGHPDCFSTFGVR